MFQKQPLEVFYKKMILKFFTKLTEKNPFFNKIAGIRPAT